MRHLAILSLVFLCLVPTVVSAGSPRLAAQVKAEYDAAAQRWALSLRSAPTPEAQLKVWEERPDPAEYGRRLWTELRTSLREDWTMVYAAWLIETAPYFVVETRDNRENRFIASLITSSLERHHINSPRIGRLCLALTSIPDPKTLKLLEKVADQNPDEKVQGQASLSAAILLRKLGDERDVMIRRKKRVRDAIIKAADVKVGDRTVGDLANDESYIVRYLSVKRSAPDIVGRDVAGRAMSLGGLRGKVVVVVFWHSTMREADRAFAMLEKLHRDKSARGMELIGVTTDHEKVLRDLKANGTVPWRNIHDKDERITRQYRIQQLPQVFVIDQKGVIQYIGAPGAFVDLAVEGLLVKE